MADSISVPIASESISVTIEAGGSAGVSSHSDLTSLDFSSAGHTGALSMGGSKITGVASGTEESDAVNLGQVLNSYGVVLNYWIQYPNSLGETFAASGVEQTELVGTIPDTLSTIYYKSAVVDTPTPFYIKAGTAILIHFYAAVDSRTSTNLVTLAPQLFYVDADGTSNPVQIGETAAESLYLITDKRHYTAYVSVPTATEVPAGKRLWLKFVATASTLSGFSPTVSIWDGDTDEHVSIGVSGSVLGRYVKLAGGTMTGDLLGAVTHGASGTRLTKVWAEDIDSANLPTVGGATLASGLTNPVQSIDYGDPLAIDVSTYKDWKCGNASGDTTLNITGQSDGEAGMIEIYNSASGTLTVGTMFTKLFGGGTVDTAASGDNLIAWTKSGDDILYSISNT